MGGLASEAVLLGLGVGVSLGEGDELGGGSTGVSLGEGDELGGGRTGVSLGEGGIGSAPVGPVGVSDSVTPSDVDVGTEPDGEPMDGEGRTTVSVFGLRTDRNWSDGDSYGRGRPSAWCGGEGVESKGDGVAPVRVAATSRTHPRVVDSSSELTTAAAPPPRRVGSAAASIQPSPP